MSSAVLSLAMSGGYWFSERVGYCCCWCVRNESISYKRDPKSSIKARRAIQEGNLWCGSEVLMSISKKRKVYIFVSGIRSH